MASLAAAPAIGSWVRAAAPFVAVTFGISWGAWAVGLALGGDTADPMVRVLWMIGACGPTLGALVLRLARHPGERLARPAAAPRWVPVALLLGAVPFGVGAVVGPDPARAAGGVVASVGGVLPFLALSLVAGPLAEEFGWRGHLQPRLRRTLSPLRASVTVGVVWAVWHAPLFLVTGSHQSSTGLLSVEAALFFLTMVPMSVGYWFVSERLRGGVPGAVLMHLAGNVTSTLLLVTPVAGGVAALVVTTLTAGLILRSARDTSTRRVRSTG